MRVVRVLKVIKRVSTTELAAPDAVVSGVIVVIALINAIAATIAHTWGFAAPLVLAVSNTAVRTVMDFAHGVILSHHYSYGFSYHGDYGYSYYPRAYIVERSFPCPAEDEYVLRRAGAYGDDVVNGSGHGPSARMIWKMLETTMADTPEVGLYSRGWLFLTAGRTKESLQIFYLGAQSDPKAGLPKLGYALSPAAEGQMDRGVWAMRRVLQYTPDALSTFTADDRLRAEMEWLIEQYEWLHDRGGGSDAAFMTAEFHYLISDIDAAQRAVEMAVSEGDRSEVAAVLKRLLDKRARLAAAM